MRALAALDDTERAPRVLGAALQVVQHMGGTVVPFRAVQPPPEFPPAAATHHRDPLPAFLLAEARGALARCASASGSDRIEAPVVAMGQTWRAIVAAADAHGVDLIVLGSHGYHGVDRVLGTTARRVADAAHQDVLVVHRSPAPIRSVLIALSGGPRDRIVLRRGLSMAEAWHAAVHLLEVIEVGHPLPRPPRTIVRLEDARESSAARPLLDLGVDHPAIVTRRVAYAVARAWRAILQLAADEGIDLVVVGSRGHLPRDVWARTTPGHITDEAAEDVLVVH